MRPSPPRLVAWERPVGAIPHAIPWRAPGAGPLPATAAAVQGIGRLRQNPRLGRTGPADGEPGRLGADPVAANPDIRHVAGRDGDVRPRPGAVPAWLVRRRTGPTVTAGRNGCPRTAGGRDGMLDEPAVFARLRSLVCKGQVRLRLDRGGVVNLYLQRAQVESALYLGLLARAYARLLAGVLTGLGAAFLLTGRPWAWAGLAVAGALVVGAGAVVARWRQERRWMTEVHRRLLDDPVFFAQAYEDGLFTLQRGRRACRYPRPWQAILGVDDPRAGEPAPHVVVRPGPHGEAAGAGGARQAAEPVTGLLAAAGSSSGRVGPVHSRRPSGAERTSTPGWGALPHREASSASPPG